MNIERTSGCNGPVMPDGSKRPPRADFGVGDTKKASGTPEATTGSEFQELARQAGAVPDVNAQAVADAKRLIASGDLSSPEAVRRAAEAMLRQGI